jgi:hypothetical protein
MEALQWSPAPMPGGSGPVQLARLPEQPDGGFRAFVRFPAGWSRLQRGHYPVAEAFVVLEGELVLNGRTYRPGDAGFVAAGELRTELRADTGCLVFAWFGGLPRWIASDKSRKENP